MTAASREGSEQFAASQLALSRRTVVKALGAGAALSAMSGSAFARSQDSASDPVRPRFGYTALNTEKPPVTPDHEVSLRAHQPKGQGSQPQMIFEPTGLFIQPGDVVRFTVEHDVHTITAYHPALYNYQRRIPQAAPAISSPVVWPNTYFLYRFDHGGVYDLLCIPHEWGGMVSRIVAGSPTGPGAQRVTPSEGKGSGMNYTSPGGIAPKILNDPALAPERIVQVKRVSWTEISSENKRLPAGGGR